MQTLVEIAQTSESNLQRGIIKKIVETSPFYNWVPFMIRPSMRHTFSLEGDLPNSGPRALGEGYDPDSTGDDQGNIQLIQYGGAFELDDELEDIIDFSGENEVMKQTKKKSRSISLNWKRDFFKGNKAADPKIFNGLQQLNSKVPTKYNATFNFGGANGKSISGATPKELLDMLLDLINRCVGMPDVIFTNRAIGQAINNILRASAANDVLATEWNYSRIEVAQGMFSKPLQVLIGSFMGIPVVFVDGDASGTEVLGFTEKCGTSNICTSMYAVKFGEDMVSGLQKRSGPIMRAKPSVVGTHYKVDWPTAVVLGHPKAVVRCKGILA